MYEIEPLPRFQHWRLWAGTAWKRLFGLNASQLDQFTWIGGQFQPEQWVKLHELGLRAVLSLQAERIDTFHGAPPERALRLPVPDFYPPTIEQLREGVAFIEQAHADQLPVYIHCHAGIGRAPLTTAAFLIAKGLNSDQALAAIRRVRPIIDLNQRQLERLREWEQAHREELG
jgi:protein-tyrosine phosphatase